MKHEDSLPASLRERLARAVERHGHVAMLRETGLAQATFFRCLAGAPVQPGTVYQVAAVLDRLDVAERS